ncbi:MAG TPA: hypothetical protein VEF35_08960 [Candidatus Bathyarchaeia archaeon]|nr:hypothetical protein [Candidatus Bathyarchaeia archaeon]
MDKKQLLQFSWRSHKFIVAGIVPLYLDVYFSGCLPFFGSPVFTESSLPMIVVTSFVAYELRKIGDPNELW